MGILLLICIQLTMYSIRAFTIAPFGARLLAKNARLNLNMVRELIRNNLLHIYSIIYECSLIYTI